MPMITGEHNADDEVNLAELAQCDIDIDIDPNRSTKRMP